MPRDLVTKQSYGKLISVTYCVGYIPDTDMIDANAHDLATHRRHMKNLIYVPHVAKLSVIHIVLSYSALIYFTYGYAIMIGLPCPYDMCAT